MLHPTARVTWQATKISLSSTWCLRSFRHLLFVLAAVESWQATRPQGRPRWIWPRTAACVQMRATDASIQSFPRPGARACGVPCWPDPRGGIPPGDVTGGLRPCFLQICRVHHRMLVVGHISCGCGCHDWLHAGQGDGTVWQYVAVVCHVHSSTLQFCRGQLPLATIAGQPRDKVST